MDVSAAPWTATRGPDWHQVFVRGPAGGGALTPAAASQRETARPDGSADGQEG